MPKGKHRSHPRASAQHRWKPGGRIASNGYVEIRLGIGHPLADPNGWGYEHLVVWVSAGNERPARGEILHHINGDKTDNRIANLEVMTMGRPQRPSQRREGPICRKRPLSRQEGSRPPARRPHLGSDAGRDPGGRGVTASKSSCGGGSAGSDGAMPVTRSTCADEASTLPPPWPFQRPGKFAAKVGRPSHEIPRGGGQARLARPPAPVAVMRDGSHPGHSPPPPHDPRAAGAARQVSSLFNLGRRLLRRLPALLRQGDDPAAEWRRLAADYERARKRHDRSEAARRRLSAHVHTMLREGW